MASGAPSAVEGWSLVGPYDGTEPSRVLPIYVTPFVIGRRPDLQLALPSDRISVRHAELLEDGPELWLHDLGSTNGTYLNGARITEPVRVGEGDWVQFASQVYRVQRGTRGRLSRASDTIHDDPGDHSLAMFRMEGLIRDRAVVPHFQPIVHVSDRAVAAHELLARSHTRGLEGADQLFSTAAQLGREVELSTLLRQEGLRSARALGPGAHLFLNTHPRELQADGLLASLAALRDEYPEPRLTLEIHEAAVTEVSRLAQLKAGLVALRIGLAFDDFGAGQSRLHELSTCPPDFVKFDISLVRDLDVATPQRRQMIAMLVQIAQNLGIVTLAEGVATESEHLACVELGFELAQGYVYGRPAAP